MFHRTVNNNKLPIRRRNEVYRLNCSAGGMYIACSEAMEFALETAGNAEPVDIYSVLDWEGGKQTAGREAGRKAGVKPDGAIRECAIRSMDGPGPGGSFGVGQARVRRHVLRPAKDKIKRISVASAPSSPPYGVRSCCHLGKRRLGR